MKILILTLLVFVLAGCSTPEYKMKKNNEGLLSLEMGMSKQQVLEVMGKPSLNEAYNSLNGKSVVIFFYYTQRQHHDSTVTKDETTPVVFENGKLVGWGSEFYENKRRIEMEVNINNR